MESVMKRPQETVQSRLSRLETLLKSGRAQQVIRESRAVLREDPHQIGALEVLAKAQWQAGQFAQLSKTIETLIKLNPYEPGYFELRGFACQALGQLGESIRSFARARDNSAAARAAVEDLRAFQVGIVLDLMKCDATFRIRYRRDAGDACRSVGLDLLPDDEVAESWIASPSLVQARSVRPS
jgi:tetratricopeptide (TPR) repeat protein